MPAHPSVLSHGPGSCHAHRDLATSLVPPPPAPHGPCQSLHPATCSRAPSPDSSLLTHSTQHYHDTAQDAAHAVNMLRISDSQSPKSVKKY
ncbi:uncharacterized protein PHACADRAFT_250259 [Phanerochaete carnosa HHB-10118-sp]|uniref:Uncharacterized protein n=1 Tax=Phanerochaete carnosa (strain HHB-10118-sp) TaxID=650164 RepID=K5V9U4_PHACS|nr:uncharacterized protein PHACADRAFT_250259 [Phanerochaete carnosa HHB-10118-sp]EKM59631.1 hypothetical protein PHACADRAFT_250259 [Phanerochaete carnosa HHB-10118-sp]